MSEINQHEPTARGGPTQASIHQWSGVGQHKLMSSKGQEQAHINLGNSTEPNPADVQPRQIPTAGPSHAHIQQRPSTDPYPARSVNDQIQQRTPRPTSPKSRIVPTHTHAQIRSIECSYFDDIQHMPISRPRAKPRVQQRFISAPYPAEVKTRPKIIKASAQSQIQ